MSAADHQQAHGNPNMKHPVLFTLGTPCAGWTGLARSLLGERLALPAFVQWHDVAVRDAQPPEAKSLDELRRSRPPNVTPALVAQLQAMFPMGKPTAGGCDTRSVWTLDALDAAVPRAAYLVFIESPAVMLARRLTKGDDGDPRRWLAQWCFGTERLLRAAHRNTSQHLLVVTQEADRRPAAVAHLVADRFGIDLNPSATAPATTIDPVALALADLLVRSDGAAPALLEEALASCTPLGAEPADLRLSADDADAAVAGLRALHKRSATNAAVAPAPAPAPVATSATADASAIDRLKSENELLLDQLQQVQQELVKLHQQTRKAVAAPPAPVWPPVLSVEKIAVNNARDAPPHRELNVVFRRVEFGTLKAPELLVRLVEHHGRAGIAVFDLAGGTSALTARHSSGKEGGRSYHLMIPSDSSHRERLDSLTTTDWLLVQSLVGHIGRTLQATQPAKARWISVAGRLGQELDALPALLRHDGTKATRGESTAGEPLLQLRLDHIVCAGREAPELRLRWRLPRHPGSGLATSTVELLRSPAMQTEALLPSWPIGDDGTPAEALALSFAPGNGGPLAASATSSSDRTFLLGLLRTLPSIAAALPDDSIPAGWTAAELASASAAMPDKAASLWTPPRWRRVAQALIGRRSPATMS